jgi:hypothetical protein
VVPINMVQFQSGAMLERVSEGARKPDAGPVGSRAADAFL